MDLDAYFARIGHGGSVTASLDTLRALTAAHTAAVPFENLDVLLGMPIRLDLPALERKLVQQRRGGYCYEQNTLFGGVLVALGFDVRGLAARVLWRAAPDAPPRPRTHMLLRVDLAQQAWLVDVGFGHTPTAPLALRSGVEQRTEQDTFRLMPGPGGLELHMSTASGWLPMYRFSGEAWVPADYEMASFYVSNAPDSVFRQQLMISRAAAGARHNLLDNAYSVRAPDGSSQEEIVTRPERLRTLITGPLGCAAPEHPDFDALLTRICTA